MAAGGVRGSPAEEGGVMSLRNRARHLQRVTNLTYQQALDRLRQLGEAPARLAREKGWSLAECDEHLVRKQADKEPPPAPARRAPLLHAAEELRGARTANEVCQGLLASSGARTVLLVDADGRRVAEAGVAKDARAAFVRSFVRPLAARQRTPAAEAEAAICAQAGLAGAQVHFAELDGGARLYVVYDGSTSLGLVRLRVAMAVAEIGRRRLLEPVVVPVDGGRGPGDGGSGAPAQVSAFDGMVDRDGKVGKA
jgi:hypothetical protein